MTATSWVARGRNRDRGRSVTLDLNGHTISGAPGSGIGVLHDPAEDTLSTYVPVIEVANGAITGFDVSLNRVRKASIHDLRVTGGGLSVFFSVEPVQIEDNHVRGGGIGVGFGGGIGPSQIVHNVVRDGGIGLTRASASVRDNLVRDAEVGISVTHGSAEATANRVLEVASPESP